MSEDTITIVIDGKDIKAQAGQTIMQAADAAGLYIRGCAGTRTCPRAATAGYVR